MQSPAEFQSGVPPPPPRTDAASAHDPRQQCAELIDRTEAEVFHFIFRRVGNRDLAWDLTQETFLRVWQAYDRLDPAQDERSWVLAIAGNVVVSDHRSATAKKRGGGQTISLEQLRPDRDDQGQSGAEVPCHDPKCEHPLDGLVRAESIEAMDRAAEELNDNDRHLFGLLREGLSTATIAELTGRTVAAVASERTRLLKKMRIKLPPP